MPHTNNQVAAGRPDAMEELVNNFVIVDGQRAFMGAVLQGLESVHTGLNDAVQGLLIGFEVSQLMSFPRKTVLTFFKSKFEQAVYITVPKTL